LRLLFGGLLISATGNWAYNVALLAYVFDHTHSLGWVGAAGLGRLLPSLLFSAYAGVVAERFERVRVMVSSDLLCVVFQTVLAIVACAAGPLAQMLVGVRTILHSPAARVPVALCALASFVYGTDTVLFVAVSEGRLGTGSEGFGYLLAGLGVGGVLAAGVVNRLAGSRRLAMIVTASIALYCLPTALLTLVHSPALAFGLQVLRGASTLVVDVLAVTA